MVAFGFLRGLSLIVMLRLDISSSISSCMADSAPRTLEGVPYEIQLRRGSGTLNGHCRAIITTVICPCHALFRINSIA